MEMNLPNKLTILRVIMIPFFVVCLLLDKGMSTQIAALILFAAASFTDYLDCHIARKNNLVTNFGKFMDPLADKLLVCSALICLIQLERIPAWVVIIIIAREFIISGVRLIASDNGVVIAASYWGKSKTVSQMFMIMLLIIHPSGDVFFWLEQIMIYLALILTVISLVDYIVKNKQVLYEQK